MATWTDPTGAAVTIYSVDGTSGVMTLDNIDNEGTQVLSGVNVEECEITFAMDWVSGAAGTISPGLYYRAAEDLSTYYKVVFDVDLDYLTQDVITGITISSESGTIATATVSKAHTVGVPFNVKIRSTQAHMVKVWSADTPQPSDWDLVGGSGSTRSGTIGLTSTASLDAAIPASLTPIFMYGAENATANGWSTTAFILTPGNMVMSSAGQGFDGVGYALVASGGVGTFTVPGVSWGTINQFTAVYHVRFGTLPGADQDMMLINGAGVDPKIEYLSATSKLRFTAPAGSGGTDGTMAGTVTSGVWYRLEFSYNGTVSPIVCNWSIDGVANTPMSYATTVPRAATNLALQGPNGTRWDDIVVTGSASDYPIGAERIIALLPSGTITEVGTANSLCRYTNNGSNLDVTFNSADIITAISEYPPTIGAATAGVYQRTSGAGNYIRVPLQNYTLQAGEGVAGARVIVSGWSSTAGTNAITIGGYDGTTETELFAGAPAWDNSTTVMNWTRPAPSSAIYTPSGGWDGTKLNNAQIYFGKSGDISPLPGAHFMMMETVIRTADTGSSTIDVEFDDLTCLACEAE